MHSESEYTAAAVRANRVCVFAWLYLSVCAEGTSEKLSKLHGEAERQLQQSSSSATAAAAAAARRVEVSKQISQCCGLYMLVSMLSCMRAPQCVRACACVREMWRVRERACVCVRNAI